MTATNSRVRALTDAQRTQLDAWLVEFERTWGEGRLADRVRELPPGPLRFPALVELVKIDLERSWADGARPRVESYLAAYPELGTPETAPADLLRAEWEARRRHGEEPTLTAYAARFPGRADDLRRLLEGETGSQTFARLSTLGQAGAPPVPDTTRLEPEVVARLVRQGRYRMVRKLGQGGMGSVYLVWDTRLDREVALKVPRFDGDETPEVRERFYREARAASGLHHPNICPVHDVGEIDGVPYLTMGYVEGEPLSQRLAAGPPPSPAEAAALVRQLARALDAAHQKGVIHRDLKPSNVMIAPNGEPVVMDFGLARRADKGDVRLTQTGALMGTPAYMSPEQAAGDTATVGPASDVYSLGVVLYELVTGRLPFTGTLSDILWKIRAEEPESPRALRPDLSPELEAIILRAMAKTVAKRYPSAGEFAAALDDHLRRDEGRQGASHQLPPTLRVAAGPANGKPSGTGQRWVWVAAAVLALGTIGLVAVVLGHSGTAGGSSGREAVAPEPGTAPGAGGGARGGDPTGREPPTGRGDKPARTPQEPVVIKRPEKQIDLSGVSPDGKTLVRVAGEKVELWDADAGKLRATLDGPTGERKSIDFSPDGRILAVGGRRRVHLWDLKDGNKELKEFKEPKEDVVHLVFTADGKRLLGVDKRGFACLWDVAEGKAVKTAELGSDVASFWWFPSPDRTFVMVAMPPGGFIKGGDPEQMLLNTTELSTKALRWSRVDTQPQLDVEVSRDGKRVLIGEADNVYFYDVDKGKFQPLHHAHVKPVSAVTWSPDGKLAASGSEDRTAVVWDLGAKKECATYKGFDGPVGVRFSPDSKTLLAWALKGNTLRRWDVATGKELPPLKGHDGGITTALFRGEGKFLLVVEDDGKVTRYDAAGLPE